MNKTAHSGTASNTSEKGRYETVNSGSTKTCYVGSHV